MSKKKNRKQLGKSESGWNFFLFSGLKIVVVSFFYFRNICEMGENNKQLVEELRRKVNKLRLKQLDHYQADITRNNNTISALTQALSKLDENQPSLKDVIALLRAEEQRLMRYRKGLDEAVNDQLNKYKQ
jgi:predicted  nucleic acid-binding Zn-ribbon protein